MREILITGLTLPKKGEKVTIELFSDGLWCDYNNNNYHGKAIEVPIHGDLIERDKLPQNHITDYNLEGHSVVDLEDVQNAPTIIEASK